MSGEQVKKTEVRKEDFISKFQINEIVPLLRIAEKYNINLGEGKKLLVKALHVAKTTRNLDDIVQYLEGSKKEIERALSNHFNRWHSFLKMDLEKKKAVLPPDSTLPYLIQTASVFIVDKNYETAASLLGKCEIELTRLPQSGSSIPETSRIATRQEAIPVIKTEPGIPESQRTEKTITYRVIMLKEMAKCGICLGKIKPDTPTIECVCGIYYHEQCGKRAGKCPNCSTVFS